MDNGNSEHDWIEEVIEDFMQQKLDEYEEIQVRVCKIVEFDDYDAVDKTMIMNKHGIKGRRSC